MSYRKKLLLLFTVTVIVVTAVVAGVVSSSSRRAFERMDQQRADALLAQFRREIARRGEDVGRRIDAVAGRESTLRIAVDTSRSSPDLSAYVNDAAAVAASVQLDLLEFVARDGTIVSSAQWPARFGYKDEWLLQPSDWPAQPAFFQRQELADGSVLGLIAVRTVRVSDSLLYVAGGERVDRGFLASLVLPAGMRAMLYRSTGQGFSAQQLSDAKGPVTGADNLAALIQEVERQPREASAVVESYSDPAGPATVHTIPLTGRQGELLGILLLASPRRELAALERHIRNVALLVAGGGILLGIVLSGWASARVTQPVESLAYAAREVAEGNWWTQVPVTSSDELGQLAEAFNRMIRELGDQRQKLVQAERVAAWRELARRLAHELKNPLFPLQITVENLVRARQLPPAEFDEVFRESTTTLLAELANLKTIISRFSDFAKMPAPQLQPVALNDVVGECLKLFEPQFTAAGRPPIQAVTALDPRLPAAPADPDLLRRAISNLVLNAMDAMAQGGTLTVRTSHTQDSIRLEIGDTGSGLTPEECERLFTPYYTTKQHGTGLGLAIVQSVVSDHQGTIAVESEPGRGTTFRIELPLRVPETDRARGANV